MRALYLYSAVLCLCICAISCSDEENLPGEFVPEEYVFDRNGITTVDFNGQTTRILMAEELISALLDTDNTSDALVAMYRNEATSGADIFINPELNASNKSIRSKTAASRDYFFTNNVESIQIKDQIEDWIIAQAEDVFPAVNQLAEPGQAGQISDGTAVRYINAKGLEYNQLAEKAMIGALMLDQTLNNYLSENILEEGDNRIDNDLLIFEEDKAYTTMEHKWDEAYGYLFGLAPDSGMPLNTLGEDDSFLNKYLSRVDNDPDFEGIASVVFDAFKLGRWAIVNKDYNLRDAQAEIIREKLSEVIAIRVVYYLQQAKNVLESGSTNKGGMFHDISEAYGLIYSLRFTRKPFSAEPYFSREEIKDILDTLLADGNNGLWNLKAGTLDDISMQIVERFEFTLAQAAD